MAAVMGIGTMTAAETEWIKIGSGTFSDFVVSTMYGYNTGTIDADYQQSASDPNTYRIYRPYGSFNTRRAEGLRYDPAKAEPLVFHVIDGKYAWFEGFNTGLYVDTADDIGPIVGEVTVTSSAEEFIKTYGLATVLDQMPTSLCKFDNGTLTLTHMCQVPTVSGYMDYPTVGIEVDGEGMYNGNRNDRFRMQMPEVKDIAPEFRWHTMEGKALFTDGFTSLLANKDVPQSPVFSVEMQQNEANPDLYRLVNPYADWNVPYTSYEFEYDHEGNYYMLIYTFPEYGVACTNTFYTGLNTKIKGTNEAFEMFGVQSQAYYFYDSYARKYGWYLEEVADDFGYMFGTFEDGVFSCPATYEDDYEGQKVNFPTFTGWRGSYEEASENDWIYSTNRQGAFKVVFPNGESEGTTAVEAIGTDDGAEPEYYDLQGRRLSNPAPGTIVIEKRGDKALKIRV